MILSFIKFVPENTKIDFFGHRWYAFLMSVVIIFGTTFSLATKGLNLGIDFTGGTMIEIQTPVDPDIASLRERLNDLKVGDITIQEFGAKRDLMLRVPQQQGGLDEQQAAIQKIHDVIDATYKDGKVDYRRTEFVGPQAGDELKQTSLIAIIISMLGIMGYIWWRFEWQYGVGAMLAIFHDVVGTLGLFSITGMHFDLATLAAILLIAGHSINDTVIIYDRVREILRKYKKMPMDEVINLAINQTLPRTIMTSGLTLLAVIALWIFGGEVIRSFVAALFFGILIGTHSSYFVASPALYYLHLRKGSKEVNGDATASA
ncbi:MAG: Protein-export rane protein SecF [Micavibrio sp.]|nr:Protein-export rane protein SecF [Micavibrio sp.]